MCDIKIVLICRWLLCYCRAMSTFPITHEAPLRESFSPQAATAAIIEERTLSNGVKIIARNGPSQV